MRFSACHLNSGCAHCVWGLLWPYCLFCLGDWVPVFAEIYGYGDWRYTNNCRNLIIKLSV